MTPKLQASACVLVMVACGVGPLWAWRSTSGQSRAWEEAAARHARLSSVIEEIERLRLISRARVQPGPVSDALAARVSSVLSARGLPTSAMTGVNPHSQPIGGLPGAPVLVHHRASLVLASLTLPQCGAFLEEFRRREPAWTVTSIELAPDAGGKVAPAADLPLRIQLTLESVAAPAAVPGSAS